MNDNIDFSFIQDKLKQDENRCEHCEIKVNIVESFLVRLYNIFVNSNGDELNERIVEFCSEYYDEIYLEGRRSAYSDIIEYAGYSIDDIDGIVEEG